MVANPFNTKKRVPLDKLHTCFIDYTHHYFFLATTIVTNTYWCLLIVMKRIGVNKTLEKWLNLSLSPYLYFFRSELFLSHPFLHKKFYTCKSHLNAPLLHPHQFIFHLNRVYSHFKFEIPIQISQYPNRSSPLP